MENYIVMASLLFCSDKIKMNYLGFGGRLKENANYIFYNNEQTYYG